MDAALGKKPVRGSAVPDTAHVKGAIIPWATLGEHPTLHLIILADAIVATGRIEDPVADIHQIQQTPELLLCHFDLHTDTPPRRRRGLYHATV